MSSVIEAAAAAVGKEGSADWDLKPETHATLVAAEAGPLRRILQRPALKEIIAIYREGDTNAKAGQNRYKRLATTAAISSFLAVVLGGLMLIPSDQTLPTIAANVIPLVQFALLAVSIGSSLMVALAKPFETWMRERAKAENARIGLFKAVMAADEPVHAGELSLLPLQLEYFRRFQLDVQRSYYRGRGGQHARAVTKAGIVRSAALVLIGLAGLPLLFSILGPEHTPAAFANLLTGLSSEGEASQRILLCSSVIGGGLQGLLASYSLLSQSERNASRYLDTARNLEDLSARPLEDARAAAASGNRELVLAFVALVHEQISSEHREWIALRSLVPDLALGKLKVASLPQLD